MDRMKNKSLFIQCLAIFIWGVRFALTTLDCLPPLLPTYFAARDTPGYDFEFFHITFYIQTEVSQFENYYST